MKKSNNPSVSLVTFLTKKRCVYPRTQGVFDWLYFNSYDKSFCIKLFFCILLMGTGFAAQNTALAQGNEFPSRTIKMIVPTSAGSGSDTTARYFAEQLAASLGVGVVVENRPGGTASLQRWL